MAITTLMVVEDDEEMREMMVQYLRRQGFRVVAATGQAEMEAHLSATRIDLILMDVMLDRENGVAICAELRERTGVPVILVSTLSADHQRMAGYEVGADDYIAKPFNPDLLVARVRAVLRRGQRAASLGHRRGRSVYRFAGWTYNARRDEVHAPDGFQVPLSRRETALLKVLLANPHTPLTRDEIASALEADEAEATEVRTADTSGRALDVLVGRLRSKIEADPKSPRLLRTERGVGYVFNADVEKDEA